MKMLMPLHICLQNHKKPIQVTNFGNNCDNGLIQSTSWFSRVYEQFLLFYTSAEKELLSFGFNAFIPIKGIYLSYIYTVGIPTPWHSLLIAHYV